MTDDALLSVPRRKLLAKLGSAAIAGVTGEGCRARMRSNEQEQRCGAVDPCLRCQ
jgi:hypothetical protein